MKVDFISDKRESFIFVYEMDKDGRPNIIYDSHKDEGLLRPLRILYYSLLDPDPNPVNVVIITIIITTLIILI